MSEESAVEVRIARRIFMNERELRAGWRLLIYVVLMMLIVLVLGFIGLALHLPVMRPSKISATVMLANELMLVAGAFGAALILGRFERRPFGLYGLPARAAFRRHFWQGLAWGFVMITAAILLIRAFGGFSFGEVVLNRGAILHFAVLWGLVFLIVGFAEEFTFRGYSQFTLATGVGFWPAAILLSAGFASLHLANPGEGPVGALSVFVIAMFFCFTLRRTGNLWFAVGLHAAWDWGETFFYSVPNSGLVAPGHLLHSSLHGPAWLSGGTVGPEGSVMAFAVIGVATVVFALVYRRPPAAPAGTEQTA